MREIKTIACQGDVLLRRVAEVPATFVQQPTAERITISHSETGHNHAIDSMGVVHYVDPQNPMVCYLRLETVESADVVHHRAWDTHETLRLLEKGSIWEVRRQREHTPEGWRRAAD